MTAQPATQDERDVAVRERSVLDVPPEAASVKTARLFAAAVARHFACSESEVEDVRLAVSEATTSAIRGQIEMGSSAPIVVAAELDGLRLTFEVTSAAPPPPAPSEASTPPGGLYEGSLGLAIIESLFHDSSIARTSDGGTLVSFSLTLVTASTDDGF